MSQAIQAHEDQLSVEDFYISHTEVVNRLSQIDLGRLGPRLVKMADRRLIQALLFLNIYTEDQLELALNHRDNPEENKSLEEIIFSVLDDVTRMKVLALRQGMQFVPLEKFPIPDSLFRLIPVGLALKHKVAPFRVYDPEEEPGSSFFPSRTVLVLLSTPTDAAAKSAITSHFASLPKSYAVEFLVANPKLLNRLVEANYTATSIIAEDEEEGEEEERNEAEDGPANEFYKEVFETAVELGASDIHIEADSSRPGGLQVRMRVDGVLSVVRRADKKFKNNIIAVMKLAFGMDISERNMPQSGRAKHRLSSGRTIELRAETLPAIDSEDIVIRLLDKGKLNLKLDEMNWTEQNLSRFRKAFKRPSGAILVTGPTGSGKTSTLYAVLQELTKETDKIITIEDPVEYTLPGLRQIQVNPKQDLDFAKVLKAILRSDPDTVMVGEIRDPETAAIAMRGANTGHLVLSTLHVNEAAAAPIQLMNMNVPDYLVAETLAAVVAQRLMRKLCMRCRILAPPSHVEMKALMADYMPEQKNQILNDLDKYKIYRANPDGCPECNKGYKGRMAIHEVLSIGDAEKEILLSPSNSSLALRNLAIAEGGMQTLRQDAILKALQGLTSLDEIRKVTTD